MKKSLLFFAQATLLFSTNLFSQNIFNGEPVQVVGSFNGYSTVPYSSDYRTTSYRRVSIASGTPVDGRGQWATTINVQSSGGDVTSINMPGGGGNGFLFISGPAGNRFQNKWVFSAVGQGAVDAVNNITAFNSGNDMGLNMSATGYYTFVFNDAGYTATNAAYYVGLTSAAPVTVTQGVATGLGNGSLRVNITTSATPSAEEKIYVRYRNTTNDFSTGTSIVQATGSGTSWTADILNQPIGSLTYYYIFTSTRTLAQLNAATESERTLSHLRYADNAGANYFYTASLLPVSFTSFSAVKQNGQVKLSWSAEETDNLSHYEVEKSSDAFRFATAKSLQRNNYEGRGTYSFIDEAPAAKPAYYRVAAIDSRGNKKYTQTLRMNPDGGKKSFTVLAAPASDAVVIRLSGIEKGTYQLNVIGSNGALMYSKTIVHNGEEQSQIVNLNHTLPAGTYYITLKGNTESFTQTILR